MSQLIEIPYMPRPLQLEAHERDGRRFAILVCHRRFGKALDVDTPVPMADGSWSTMGALKDGDRVIGSNGEPTTVIQAHAVLHDRECYEVEFDNGEVIVADADHLWSTTRKMDRHHPVRKPDGSRPNCPRGPQARTTREISETLISRGEFNHRVQTACPVEHPARALPVTPYLLGLWLGDGTSRAPAITTMDEEIVSWLERECVRHGWTMLPVKHQSAGLATTYRINGGLQSILTENCLLGDKNIPEMYFRSSIEQRLDLLAGLMDTDGSINKAGNWCEITQKRENLSDGIERLLFSLGMQASRAIKIINGRPYYRISFRPTMQVFRLRRKAIRYVEPLAHKSFLSIVRVERVESRPVRCITVDAPDSLYLVGRKYVVTHNTVFSVNEMIKSAAECPLESPRFAYIAPLYRQAKAVAWDMLKTFTRPIPETAYNEAELRADLPNGARISLYGADNPDSLRGIYLDGVVLDEYEQMSERLWPEVVRPALADRKGWAIFIGTPMGHGKFFELYEKYKDDPDWYVRIHRASETGYVDPEELEAARKDMSPGQYQQEFECSWTAAIVGAYYGQLLEDAGKQGRIGHVNHDPSLSVETWWDLGMGDATAIWFAQRNGPEIRLIDYYDNVGEPLSHYVHVLRSKAEAGEWNYSDHVVPHDARQRMMDTGKSRVETLQALGVNPIVLPVSRIEDGIDAVRRMLPNCWFDDMRCARGLDALRQYRSEYDDKRRTFKARPVHDWTSDPADAFRYGAMHNPVAASWKPLKYSSAGIV